METRRVREAKRHIFRCLITTLMSDMDNRSGYLMELLDDPEADSHYDGERLSQDDLDAAVQSVITKLSQIGRVASSLHGSAR
jgi:hypothetical protein